MPFFNSWFHFSPLTNFGESSLTMIYLLCLSLILGIQEVFAATYGYVSSNGKNIKVHVFNIKFFVTLTKNIDNKNSILQNHNGI